MKQNCKKPYFSLFFYNIQFLGSRNRIEVSTLRCGRSNPGSNPGYGRNIFCRCGMSWKVVNNNSDHAKGWGSSHMWPGFFMENFTSLLSGLRLLLCYIGKMYNVNFCFKNLWFSVIAVLTMCNVWFDIHNMVDYCYI